jgi:NADH:ubiquinone oxidoreductase subunit H
MTSTGVNGIILVPVWRRNSKYAFSSCLRSQAQIVSLRDRDGLCAWSAC